MKLLEYIKGHRKGKDAYRIERQAMDDPFLADALEGFDSVDGDHVKRIEILQKKISKRLEPKTYQLKAWGIAASILICVSIGGYFIVQNINKIDFIASVETKEESNPIENQEIAYSETEDTLSILIPEKEIRKIRTIEREDFPMADMQMERMPISVNTLQVASIESNKTKVESNKTKETQEPEYQNEAFQSMIRGISTSPIVVRGKIVDQEGEPLVGVSVTQKGTQNGAVTDIDGTFSLKTNNNTPLEARYLGFDSKEIPINASAPMLIAMNEDKQTLSEVVVIGYSTQRKSNITGSVSGISPDLGPKPSPLMGMKAYQRYIKDNMKRPTDAVCGDKKGTVVLEFYVNEKGIPVDINIKKSVCVSMDIEAIRLLQQGPKWTTGKQIAELKVKF